MKKIILALILAFLPGFPSISNATVSNGTNQVIYSGDGVSTIFAFSFNVYNTASENDLLVSTLNTATGAVTNLTINTNYTVSLTHAIPSPGTITLTTALPVGTNLSILRNLPLTQLVTEADNSATPASVRNNVYDRQVMVAQQLQQQLTRAVLQNIFATTSITLPAAVANYGLCWDSTGTSLTNCASLSGTIGVPIANGNLQTLTAAGLVNGSSLFGSATLTSLATGTLTTTSNVGINSATPGSKLDVQGTVRILSGNVGIGSSSPGTVLDVVGTVRATAFTGVGGSGLLGPWTSPTCTTGGTSHQAATDGMFTGQVSADNINCLTDSNSTPSTIRSSAPGVAAKPSGCSSLVKKGDFYMVTTSTVGCINYFISLAS